MIMLRQSTASQPVPLGTFVSSTDGNTEQTGLTIANTDIKIWKCAATTLASKNSGGGSYISNGVYYCTLDATDTNTLGSLVIYVHVATALPVKIEACVLAANIYDSLVAASVYLKGDLTQILTTAVSTPATAGILDVNIKNMNNVAGTSITTVSAYQGMTQPVNFTGTGTSALAKVDVTDIATAAVATGSAQLGVNLVNIAGAAVSTSTAQLGVNAVQIGAAVPGSATIGTVTTVTTCTNLTNAPTVGDLTATMKTSVTTAATAATPTAAAVTGAVGSVTAGVTVTTNNDKTGYTASTVSDKTGYSLASAPPALSAIINGVWDELISGHLTTGSTGKALNSAGSAGDPWGTGLPGAYGAGTAGNIVGNNLNAKVGDVKSKTDNLPASPAAVGSNMGTVSSVTGAVGSVTAGVTVTTNNDKTGYALSVTPPTAIQIRTEMDSNSTKLANLDAAVSSRSTYAGGAVASVAAPVTVGANNDKTGYALSVTPPTAAQVRTEMDSNSTQLAAIKAKTDNLPTSPKKNVALSNLEFVMFLTSDHVTPATGMTVSVVISQDGGVFTSSTNSVTEISDGAYKISLTQAEMNADSIMLKASAAGCDDTFLPILTSA